IARQRRRLHTDPGNPRLEIRRHGGPLRRRGQLAGRAAAALLVLERDRLPAGGEPALRRRPPPAVRVRRDVVDDSPPAAPTAVLVRVDGHRQNALGSRRVAFNRGRWTGRCRAARLRSGSVTTVMDSILSVTTSPPGPRGRARRAARRPPGTSTAR